MIYNVLPNANGHYGMGVLNATSLESVQKQLASYPAFLLSDFEVYGLSDVEQSSDDVNAALKKLVG